MPDGTKLGRLSSARRTRIARAPDVPHAGEQYNVANEAAQAAVAAHGTDAAYQSAMNTLVAKKGEPAAKSYRGGRRHMRRTRRSRSVC